ncbi:MAG: BolA family protein [Alphaproteobacteria bacterium]|jgi:BolA protein
MNESTIYKKLFNFFEPEILEVINDSHKHQGHSSSPNTGNSHFTIKIKSSKLSQLNRIQGQREVYNVLKSEMQNQIHALSIKIL